MGDGWGSLYFGFPAEFSNENWMVVIVEIVVFWWCFWIFSRWRVRGDCWWFCSGGISQPGFLMHRNREELVQEETDL